MMQAWMVAVWAGLLLLHPGHSTRVEVQYDPQQRTIELAMRIDHADLEAALQKRLDRRVVIEELDDEQAAAAIGDYLRATLRIDGKPLQADHFEWVGWQRRQISSWIYAELAVAENDRDAVELEILTLYETEPELNHVVTVREGQRVSSRVLSKQRPTVTIGLGNRSD